MMIFGAVDFTAALTRVGQGARLPRRRGRRPAGVRHPARFPMADEVVVDWPDRYLAPTAAELGPRDAVCVLTHDHKFDVPAVVAALDHACGLSRRHGLASDRSRAPTNGCATRASTDDQLAPSWPRSAWTSGPGRPRRPPCRSAPRSSPSERGVGHRACATLKVRSTPGGLRGRRRGAKRLMPEDPGLDGRRIADADRDRIVAVLRRHCGDGRITLDEFGDLVGDVYGARTAADLDAVIAQLPVPWTASLVAACRCRCRRRTQPDRSARTAKWFVSVFGDSTPARSVSPRRRERRLRRLRQLRRRPHRSGDRHLPSVGHRGGRVR